MNDRELLKLAAKAAGGFRCIVECGWIEVRQDGTDGKWWDPLTDDGDALRLAVKLKMDVETYSFGFDSGPCVNILLRSDRMRGLTRTLYERVPDEDYGTATRRAIVCAAAEIGRVMP